jgi:hypothetical protein
MSELELEQEMNIKFHVKFGKSGREIREMLVQVCGDFFLFPKIKEILKGRHFDDIDDIRSNMTAALKVISQNQFQNCFEGWTRRWHRCIASQGEYFEGNHSDIQQLGMEHFYRDEFANFYCQTMHILEL